MKQISTGSMSRFPGLRISGSIFAAGVLAVFLLASPSVYAAPALNSVIDVSPFSQNGMVVAPNGETLYVAATGAGVSKLLVINTQFNTITAVVDLFNLNNPGHKERGCAPGCE
jgi:hypothetical protein